MDIVDEKLSAAQRELEDLKRVRAENDAKILKEQTDSFEKRSDDLAKSRLKTAGAPQLTPSGDRAGYVSDDRREAIKQQARDDVTVSDQKFRQQEWRKFEEPIAKAEERAKSLQQEKARLEDIAARPKAARMEAELQARQHQKDREGQSAVPGRYDTLKTMGAQGDPAREPAHDFKQSPPQTLQAELAHERSAEQKAAADRAADQQKLEEIRARMAAAREKDRER